MLRLNLFEALFPNNKGEYFSDKAPLQDSISRVMETKKEHIMDSFRHDIQNNEGVLEEKYWRYHNTSVLDAAGNISYILHSACDVSNEIKQQIQIELMINNTEESFMLIDREFKILNFNDNFFHTHKAIFGYKVEKGQSIFEYVDEEYQQAILKKYQQVLKGETLHLEFPFKDKEGEERIFEMVYKPISDQDGAIYSIYISRQDITEKHRIKQETEIKEARFRALVETGNDVVIIISAEGSPTYVSPSIKNVLNYKPEEILNLGISELVHPDDQLLVSTELKKSLNEPGVPITVPPARMKHKDGSWRWFDGTITNLLHDPAINGIVDNFKEITEKVETENKLIETKELYKSLLQSIEGVVWEAQADTLAFNFVSKQSIEPFGYTQKVFIDNPNFWKDNIHPDDRDKAVNYCISQTAKGKDHEIEYRFKKANGEYIWLRDVARVIQKDGIPYFITGTDARHYRREGIA